MTEDLNKHDVKKEKTKDEPVVYTVQKDLKGWKFSRRKFIELTVVTATAGSLVVCGETKAPVATDTPTSTSTPDPTPKVVMKFANVSLRSGPGDRDYSAIKDLEYNEVLEVLSRNDDGSWFRVITDAEEMGCIPAASVSFDFSIENISIETNISTPSPTATRPRTTPPTPNLPGVEGTVESGQEGIKYTYTDEQGVVYTRILPCGVAYPCRRGVYVQLRQRPAYM